MSSFRPWPKEWPKYYNASSDPCDMQEGHCACGAAHQAGEFVVREDGLYRFGELQVKIIRKVSMPCPECGSIMSGSATLKCTNCGYTSARGPCVTCGQPATTDWVGEGGIMGWAHGMSVPRCERCCLVDQVAHAREVAVRLPELEAKLREIDSRFCNCTHAPEQHGPDGCTQCPVPSFSRPSRNCPWDGRKR